MAWHASDKPFWLLMVLLNWGKTTFFVLVHNLRFKYLLISVQWGDEESRIDFMQQQKKPHKIILIRIMKLRGELELCLLNFRWGEFLCSPICFLAVEQVKHWRKSTRTTNDVCMHWAKSPHPPEGPNQALYIRELSSWNFNCNQLLQWSDEVLFVV